MTDSHDASPAREPRRARGGPAAPEQPPRGVKLMAALRWLLLLAVTALAAHTVWHFWGPGAVEHAAHHDDRFYCPMHPQIRASEPGECPICHMSLEPIPQERRGAGAATASAANADAGVPASAMHGASFAIGARDAAAGSARRAPVPGLAPVALSLERQQLIGMATAPVLRSDVGESLRVPAVVEVPQDAVAQVHARASGFIERIAVAETGVVVRRGEPLAWLYSPEIFQAQQELLTAHRWAATRAAEAPPSEAARGGASPDALAPSVATPSTQMELAARLRLDLLGVAPDDVRAILLRNEPLRAVPLRAPRGGYVIRRAAVLGLYATPEAVLYELADLSTVWVVASIFERDLPRIQRGMLARFVVAGAAGAPITARVALVEPELSSQTRTARVRLNVRNTGLRLRPGQYGDVRFELPSTSALTIPRDAVADTGAAQYAFVDRGEGHFEPRLVRTGAITDGQIEVLDGLAEGERVVTRGNFLVDSESRLQSALAESPVARGAAAAGSAETGPDCETEFDRQRFAERYAQCRACERSHRGMGRMEADCKAAIARPWR